jgi:hypothetical protein
MQYIYVKGDETDPIGQTRVAMLDEEDKVVRVLTPIEIMDPEGTIIATLYSEEEAHALVTHLNR